LVSRLREEMTEEERRFIVSVKDGKPEWNLLGVPGIENLPAVQWKLQNIRRMARQNTGRHYKNSATTLAYNLVLFVFSP
jgi:hypothetical protein